MNALRRLTHCTALAGIALVLSTGLAHAQFFNYVVTNFNPSPIPGSAGGQITVTNGTATGVFAGLFGSDIVLNNFLAFSTAPNGSPETINAPFTVDVTLQGAQNGAGTPTPPGTLVTHTFSGTITGTMSTNTAVTNATLNFTPQTYVLDNGTFIVELKSYTGPGAPGTNIQGSLNAHVTGPLATGVPEPGSLAMLLGSGVSGSLFLLRRRRA